jgi:hypothetical protein
MKRMLAVIAVFGSVCLAGSAVAQGPVGGGGFKKKFGPEASGTGSIQKLERQVEALRIQIRDLEIYLKRGAAKEGRGYGRGWGSSTRRGYGPPARGWPGASRGYDKKGPWGYGPAAGREWWKEYGGKKGPWAYGPPPGKGPGGPGGFDKKGPKGFGPPPGKGPAGAGGFDKKGFGPPPGKGPGGPPGGFDKKAFGQQSGTGPGGRGAFDKKAFNPPAAAPKAASTQERLDQIIREIGELRRALKNQ